MLYNGERVGDGTGPEVDVAVDPIDGTTLTAKGMTNALSVIAVAERGTMFDPSARLLHGEARRRPGGRRRRRHHGAGRARTSAGSPRPRARRSQRRHGLHPRPPPPRGPRRRDPRRRAPGSSSSPTATSPARSWPPARTPASTCCSASAARPRASSPPARSSASAASSRASCGPRDDDERAKALDAGHDLDRVLTHRRPRHQRQLLLRRHRHHRRRAAPAASATPRQGATTQSLVMRSKSGTIRLIASEHRLAKLGDVLGDRLRARGLTPSDVRWRDARSRDAGAPAGPPSA